MISRRLMETAAMTIIGDSFLCVLSPRRHTSLWLEGPQWWQRAWKPFVRHPGLTRALGAFGIGFGVWLAWRQEPRAPELPLERASTAKRWARTLAEAAR